jgi:AraC-like DNA-binding protein
MATIPLTKAHQFWPLTDYLRDLGVPVGTYIERAHLPKKMLEAPDLYVDESRFWHFANDVARHEGILDWGFKSGQQLNFSVLGGFGDILLQQPTLKIAVQIFTQSISAEVVHCHSEVMRQGNCCWFILQQNCPNGPPQISCGKDIVELYNLQFMLKLVRNAVGRDWLPHAVHLQCPSLPSSVAITELSGGSIRFSSTMTAFAIPTILLSAPMSNYRSSSDSHSVEDQSEVDFPTSLRMLLAGYLDESLTINQCADLVGMSSRTLQRRLAEGATSFNELLDQTRFDTAKQLLKDDSLSVSEVCYELGYTDSGNFTRAFRRWTGVSPRQHRQLHRALASH